MMRILSGINMRAVVAPGLRPRHLLRGGSPAFTTDETAQELRRKWNVRTVVDLRSEREIARDGSGTALLRAGIELVNAELTGYSSTTINSARPRPEDFVPYYLEMLRTPCWPRIFEVVAAASAHPFTLMCACGKDRTGVVTALLLAAIGVPDEAIAADYALTREHLRRDLDLFADKWLRRGHTRDDWVVRTATEQRTVLTFLSTLREEFGDVRSALRASGVRPAHLDELARNLRVTT